MWEVLDSVGASLHCATSSSLLLLFLDSVALGCVKRATFTFSGFSSCALKLPCWQVSNQSQILFLAKSTEALHFRKSLNPAGTDGTPNCWCGISAPCFPFLSMQMLLMFLMWRSSGLDCKKACAYPWEKQSNLLCC